MSKSELLVRSILGPIRSDIRPLVYAIEIASDLYLFRKFHGTIFALRRTSIPLSQSS